MYPVSLCIRAIAHQFSLLLCHRQIILLRGVWENLDLIGYTERLDASEWGHKYGQESASVLRLIVANQRLQSPITLSGDYYHLIGQGKRLVGREEGMKR